MKKMKQLELPLLLKDKDKRFDLMRRLVSNRIRFELERARLRKRAS